jgi:hypothetical protein
MNTIQLVSNSDVEVTIGLELLKYFETLTFIAYKLGIYDESSDKILKLELLKVCFYFFTYKNKILLFFFLIKC